jgi:hypothetical protein
MFRRTWAEKYDLGFELPAVVPNVPKDAALDEAAQAA